MRYALPLILCAGPAYAHHEVVVTSVLPGAVMGFMALSAAVATGWKIRRKRRKAALEKTAALQE